MESLTDDITNWQTFLAIVIVNLLAIFVFILCERKNLQFYNDHLNGLSQAKYTLSRRFQLVENIKIAKFIKKLFFGAFMFNVLLGGNYFLILITTDVHTQNLFVEMFDLLSPLYGSTIPVVYLLTNKILQVDIRRAFFSCCNNSVEQDLNSKTPGNVVVDVFGRNLIQHSTTEGHQYFAHLKKIQRPPLLYEMFAYKSGVFNPSKLECEKHRIGDHVFAIIGYGTENKEDYWLLKNNWGTTFGEHGYIKMKIGVHSCGMGAVVVAPLL
uniref:Pept_C1 domain-containing protein n=1 Tax=Panagrellus redivivus TaxID=6233 RepID=A0A7E4UMN0_PANRE